MRHFLLLLIATAFFSCQTDRPQEAPMYANFFVRYLEEEQQLKAHVSFYEGDTLTSSKPVIFDGDVTFQGNRMQPREIVKNQTFRYVYNGSDAYNRTFSFKFPKSGLGKQEYTVAMSPIEDFAVKNDKVSLSDGMVLELKGEPLLANEKLVLLFTSENNVSIAAEFAGPFDVAELNVPAVQISGVEPGKNALYLVKKQTSTGRAGNVDCTSNIEFYTKLIEVEVVE